MTVSNDIRYLKGVGEKRAQLLARLGIGSAGALLRYYPRRYEDWSRISPIFDDNLEQTVCVKAKIVTPIISKFIRKNMTVHTFGAEDDSGRMKVTFFNADYTVKSLTEGETYLFYGKMEGTPFIREMSSPKIAPQTHNGMQPIYNVTKGLNSKVLSGLVKTALQNTEIEDPIPESLRLRENLCDLKTALYEIHFPTSEQNLKRARYRLIFEELFLLQTGMALFKTRKKQPSNIKINPEFAGEFFSSLPFSPTDAQMRATSECLKDMNSNKAMSRLIQGDVGSGKTLVAAALVFATARSGYQSAVMAPTEILAEQHFNTMSGFFAPFGIECCLVTGSLTAAKKRKLRERLASGEIAVAIGTHALFSEGNEFKNLGLVVTDEQHRFGVSQRASLAAKGNSPHTAVMSATPIPRTLAMTIYGDLDLSVIDQYPKGRQPIETYAVGSKLHERIYKFIDKHIDEGRQVYIICPLVDPSESEEDESLKGLTCATEYYEFLSKKRFVNRRVGLLHGKMKAVEKAETMRKFAEGETDILVSTTVVEVGVDVPNAALMVIENAERFGLSQLHQLRGRIGRGSFKSTCVLVTDNGSQNTRKRMNVLCKTRDGFEIADEDLKLRGPGDFLGRRQHGLPELKIADMAEDISVLRKAGAAAAEIISRDESLSLAENKNLAKAIDNLFSKVD